MKPLYFTKLFHLHSLAHPKPCAHYRSLHYSSSPPPRKDLKLFSANRTSPHSRIHALTLRHCLRLSTTIEREMATNIGIMDAAYFVSRYEILSWINSTLQLSLSKIEEVYLLFLYSNLIVFYNFLVYLFCWIVNFSGMFRHFSLPASRCESS